jgi:hypothetical protein
MTMSDTHEVEFDPMAGMRQSLANWDVPYTEALAVGQRLLRPLAETIINDLGAEPAFIRPTELGSVMMTMMGDPCMTLHLHRSDFATFCEAVTRMTGSIGFRPSKIAHSHSAWDMDRLQATWLVDDPDGEVGRVRVVLNSMGMELVRKPNMPSHGLETAHLDLHADITAACAQLMGGEK